jgi:hypothetical protein
MTDADYPSLRYLVSSYLFQDYDDEGDGRAWAPAIAEAVGAEPAETLAAIAADIDLLLATPATEAELTELLDAMGSDVDHSPATPREWLTAVRDRLAASL